jgi:hypothetical protein
MRVFGAALITTFLFYICIGIITVLYFGAATQKMVTLNWLVRVSLTSRAWSHYTLYHRVITVRAVLGHRRPGGRKRSCMCCCCFLPLM